MCSFLGFVRAQNQDIELEDAGSGSLALALKALSAMMSG
jgi:hypothetical protein